MPAGAKVMSVAWRKSRVVLWALVDPEVPKVKRRVKLLSTGNEISGEGWEFAGTALAPRDRIFHVFLEIV